MVGIPDVFWGEVVSAFIQRRTPNEDPLQELGKKELKMWLRSRLPPHKMPEHFFWTGEDSGVPDQLPINHSGKVLKAQLRTIASELVSNQA